MTQQPSQRTNIVHKTSFTAKLAYVSDVTDTALLDFFADPEPYLATSNGPFFKSEVGDTTTVGVVTVAGKCFVVKRYNFRNVCHALKCHLRPSRAKTSWRNAWVLPRHGIATIKPVALLEKRFGLLRRKAYFISEYVDGVRGQDYFANDSEHAPHWSTAAHAIKQLSQQLADAKLYHPDFQHRNMIIVEHRPILLDLDYIRPLYFGALSRNACDRRHRTHFIERLAENLVAQPLCRRVLLGE